MKIALENIVIIEYYKLNDINNSYQIVVWISFQDMATARPSGRVANKSNEEE